jgi:hypothetical protein
MILLALNYTYGVGNDKWNDERDRHTSYVIIPTFVSKYYFRIKGKYYAPSFQIIENTTYNMSKKDKDDVVILKCTFMKLIMTRTKCKLNSNGEQIETTLFTSNIFSKDAYPFNYILAKIGYQNTLKFLGLEGTFVLSDEPHADKVNFYSFKAKGYYVIVPIYLFINNPQLQSFIASIIKSGIKYNDLFKIENWVDNLGKDFSQKYTFEKGLKVLESLEGMYDKTIYDACNLPYEYKKNIYCILRWLVYEFSELMIKDNLDLATKKLRCEEYIAQMYGVKLSTNVRKIADMKNAITMYDIKKYINIRPDFLLGEIKTCSIINYKNISNDHDTFLGAKYSFKGPGGLDSSTKGSKIPDKYKQLKASHLGVLGLANTNNQTPGIQGTLTPMIDLSRFASYKEPNFWFENMEDLLSKYFDSIKTEPNPFRDDTKVGVRLDSLFYDEWNHLLDEHYGVERTLIPVTRMYKNVEIPSYGKPIKRPEYMEETHESE